MLIPVLTFVVVASVIFGAYWVLMAAPEVREQGSLRKRLKGSEPTRVLRVALLKEQEKLSSIPVLDALLNGSGAPRRGIEDQARLERSSADRRAVRAAVRQRRNGRRFSCLISDTHCGSSALRH